MKIAELLKKAGIEVDAAKVKELQVEVDKEQKIETDETVEAEKKALKGKNDELIGEKRKLQEREKTALEEVEKAKEDAIKEKGSAADLKKFYEDRETVRQEELAKAKDAEKNLKLENSKNAVYTSHIGKFKSPAVGKKLMGDMIEIADDGTVIYKDLLGKVIASDQKEFDKYLAESEDTKYLILGSQAAGGGAGGAQDGDSESTEKQTQLSAILEKSKKGEATTAEIAQASVLANEISQESQES